MRHDHGGTAFDYLHPGDVIQRHISGSRGFAGVSVVHAQAVAGQTGGWVDAQALGR